MSEHQVYDFVAVDRPLTKQEIDELRAISTRAEISTTRFWNEYHWGDLKADPRELLARYFDVHVYVANWGERHFMVRLPAERVDRAALRPYLGTRHDVLTKIGDHYILELHASEDSNGDGDEAKMVDAAGLVSLRAGLLHGDMRVPYLAWLLAVQDDRIPDAAQEPPVPPGLRPLSGALAALAEVLQLDEALLQAAAEASTSECRDPDALRVWIDRLVPKEKDRWLLRAVERPDQPLGAEMLAAFDRATTPKIASKRSAGQLRARAEVLAGIAEREAQAAAARRAKQQETARRRRLTALAREADRAWTRLEALVEARKYDDAVALAVDLHDVALEQGNEPRFLTNMTALKQRHSSRRGFFTRLKERPIGALR